jgi:hypothetical protein
MPQVFGTAQATSSTNERKLIFVGTNTSPFLRWGVINDQGTITFLPNPDVLPTGAVRGISVFPDGSKVVVAHDGGNSFVVYNIGDTSLTKDTTVPTLAAGGGGQSVHVSKDGQQVAIGTQSGQFLYVYSYGIVNPNEWVLLAPFSTMPTAVVRGVRYNHSGNALVIAQNVAAQPALAYTRSGSVYTLRSLPEMSTVTGGRSVNWSSSNMVHVASDVSTATSSVQSWSLSGTTFTKLAIPTVALQGNSRVITPSAGGSNLFIGLSVAPFIQCMSRYGNTIVDTANIETYNTINSCAGLSPNGTILGAATSQDNSFVAFVAVDSVRKLWLFRPLGTHLDFVPCADVSGTASAVSFYPRVEDL